MRSPYEVYEAVHGKYNPDVPPTVIFSVWMAEQKAAYLVEHPETRIIDGHFFYDRELRAFFEWIDARYGGSHGNG